MDVIKSSINLNMSILDILKNKDVKKINSICLFKMDMSILDIIRFIPLMRYFNLNLFLYDLILVSNAADCPHKI